MSGKIIRQLGRFIKGLGIPTDYEQVIRYINLGRNWTYNNVTEITIQDCTGGKLIYTNTKDGWWVRYDSKEEVS